ncbi:MAG: hypothetical protein IJW00_01330 [Clostridia bacterium]|nr:hypothetical protein [Clostridia bacterium]
MKRRTCILRSLCGFLTVLLFCALPLTVIASEAIMPQAIDLRRAPYIFSIDMITNGTGVGGTSSIRIYNDFVFPESGVLTMKGWIATDEGIDHYEYAWISGLSRVPVWETAPNMTIVARPDLAAAEIPYPGGHGTAGFSFDVCPPDGIDDGYYDLYVRAVTGDGVGCDMVLFSHMMYGTPDYDDGEMHKISFPRLKKTAGALTNATVTDAGLVITNESMVALGALELGEFDRVRITYTLSQRYTDGRQALIGFKSAADHLYGNGEGQYDLTNHLTALPLNTSTTEPQTAELDLSKVDLTAHESLYLASYIKDDVTLTVHEIELTYRGKGYDRTAAKIYFSLDIVNRYSGINKVDLKGVQDPVMGEVLRIEVNEETNDPYAHFNASALLSEYDLRLNADDYQYMVVLARANKDNTHSSMTFYLCAGSILGATEACTYSHQLIKDGQWHYYVFDLTARENWKGNINGWRFDIINGDSAVGNYVDFATIQFFRTPEAAAAAAKASVTQNVTPHALGMPAVVRDDTEETIVSDAPMTFKDGEWFEETTAPETQPATSPEETRPHEPVVTQPQTQFITEAESENPKGSCGSVISVGAVALLAVAGGLMLCKKKKE